MTTQHDRYVAALKRLGFQKSEVVRTSKYTVMAPPILAGKEFLFIGRAGAVRRGQTVTGSVPVSEAYKAKLLASA